MSVIESEWKDMEGWMNPFASISLGGYQGSWPVPSLHPPDLFVELLRHLSFNWHNVGPPVMGRFVNPINYGYRDHKPYIVIIQLTPHSNHAFFSGSSRKPIPTFSLPQTFPRPIKIMLCCGSARDVEEPQRLKHARFDHGKNHQAGTQSTFGQCWFFGIKCLIMLNIP